MNLKQLIANCLIAGTLTLAWDANTEPDLAGYKIHIGKVSGNYDTIIYVKDQPPVNCPAPYDPFNTNCCEITLTDLTPGKTYYFAATAYDQDNNESAYSEELTHTFTGKDETIKFPNGYRKK